ncbi:MAG: hypothetical protein HZB68_01750 [Candidatus Aenigmarchaeota archaeon]|nr:hypothetical protein [Candidatus Aenigmarchaeota archaeon]
MAYFFDAEDAINQSTKKLDSKGDYIACAMPFMEAGQDKDAFYIDFDPFSPLGKKRILAYEGIDSSEIDKIKSNVDFQVEKIYGEAERLIKQEIESRKKLISDDLWLFLAPPAGAYFMASDYSRKGKAEKALKRLEWMKRRWGEAEYEIVRSPFPYDGEREKKLLFKAANKFSKGTRGDMQSVESYKSLSDGIKKSQRNISLPTGEIIYE